MFKLKKNYPIYLDYFSTTPIDNKIIKKIIPYLKNNFGNPSSRSHIYGWDSEKIIKYCKKKLAKSINVNYKNIIWTSGATESNNLALKGSAYFYKNKGNHIISVKSEHKSVLNTLNYLETKGFEITYLKINNNGLIDINDLYKKVKKNTIIISIMLVNNEIGVIQPIKKIGNFCNNRNIIFHCDAAQAIGKININIKKFKINLMSLSSHKIYGPKGIGALYISNKPKIKLINQMHGGNQEYGLRAGTLALHQIIGISEAFKISKNSINIEIIRIIYLYKRLLKKIKNIKEIYINGDLKKRVPHNLNISFNYIEGESLIMAIKNIAVSSGSACTSSNLEPSYVLKSIGRNSELAHSSIRFSIGRFTTKKNIDFIINLIILNVNKLRNISPLWEMYENGININNVKWL